MTATSDSARNPMAAAASPLTLGVGGYAELMRRQVQTTMELTTAWATAVSAMSGVLISRSTAGGPSTGEATSTATARRLRAVPTVGEPIADEPLAPPTQQEHHLGQPGGRMLGWLTTTPTLHPDLFDEAMVLLVDEDIKTAS